MQWYTQDSSQSQDSIGDLSRILLFLRRVVDGTSTKLTASLCFYVPVMVAISVKIYRLNSRELWLDETYSALLASMPFKQMLRSILGDVHPPFFYILLWAWIRLVGESEIALRLFSVLLNTVGTIAFFFVLRKWLGTRAAAFGSFLFAFSPILYVYSLEVRMYMLVVCCVIAILGVHKMVTTETNLSWFYVILYSFLCSLLYYTHYIGLFVLIALFADWIIATRFQVDQLSRLLAAALLVILLMSGWIPIMFHQRARKIDQTKTLAVSYQDPGALTFGESPAKTNLRDSLRSYIRSGGVAVGLYPSQSAVGMVCLGLPIVIVLVGAVYFAMKNDPASRLFLIVTVAVFAGIVVLKLDETRYLLPILPFMFLAMSRIVKEWSNSRWRLLATVIAAFVLVDYAAGFTRQVTRNHPRPWSALVSSVRHNYGQNDVVLFDALYGQVVFDYYAKQVDFHPREVGFPESIYVWWGQQTFKGWGGPVVHKSDLEATVVALEKLPEPKRVWLVLYEANYYDPKQALLTRLSRMGKTVEFQPSWTRASSPDGSGEHPRLFKISGE
jgi:uncharacterized membrane protein